MTQPTAHTAYPDLGDALDNLLKDIENEEREIESPANSTLQPVVVKTEVDSVASLYEPSPIYETDEAPVVAPAKTKLEQIKVICPEAAFDAVKTLAEPAAWNLKKEALPASDSMKAGTADSQSVRVQLPQSDESSQSGSRYSSGVPVLFNRRDSTCENTPAALTKVRSRKSLSVKKIPREKAVVKTAVSAAPVPKPVVKAAVGPAPLPKQEEKVEAVVKSDVITKKACEAAKVLVSSEQINEVPKKEQKRKRPIVEYFILADPSKPKDVIKDIIKNKTVEPAGNKKRKLEVEADASPRQAKKAKLTEKTERVEQSVKNQAVKMAKTEVKLGRRSEPRSESKSRRKSITKSESQRSEVKDEYKNNKKAGAKLKYQDPKLVQVPDNNPYARKVKSFRRRRGDENETRLSNEEAFKAEVEHNKKVALLGKDKNITIFSVHHVINRYFKWKEIFL
jgi:hypothetical protein